MAEHLALNTLREAGVPAAKTQILDHGAQRFLEVERFDRTGKLGRRALISLAVLNAEFVGAGTGGWPAIARHLAVDGLIRPQAADGADLLWAFGTLIGNSDMHNGNLSFVSDDGRPYDIAPAYDMTPMTFAPRSGGRLPDTLSEASIHASVANETWRRAEALAARVPRRGRGLSNDLDPASPRWSSTSRRPASRSNGWLESVARSNPRQVAEV
ncbi:HipA domain-containing protein [Candidatus Accumulibacter sp. ACC012]|uniref:HipA domain-containing protein n=1 Tax=Candidatus Accumulibacter sp. ACC012 TaxID=2823332 RepID=UPI00342D2B76